MAPQFFSIGLIALLGAMLPGPDFLIVTKNTLLHSRKAGYLTAIGVGSAIVVHLTYCIAGLAYIISKSPFLFGCIKYVGAIYLIYLGITTLFSKTPGSQHASFATSERSRQKLSSYFTSFRQGFFCNLFNPKATLFFLALFTVVIRSNTPIKWEITYAIEIITIAIGWFCAVTLILSHQKIKKLLEKSEKYIEKTLGLLLVFFGFAVTLLR